MKIFLQICLLIISLSINYGSTVTIKASQKFLYSSDVYFSPQNPDKVVSGSDEQSLGSYWVIYNPYKTYQDSIQCNDEVQLINNHNKQYLSNTNEQSPISKNQEVVCNDGTNSKWIIECNGKELKMGDSFYLRNVKTQSYLYLDYLSKFDRFSCGPRCPIMGNYEASGRTTLKSKLTIESGLMVDYVKDQQNVQNDDENDGYDVVEIIDFDK